MTADESYMDMALELAKRGMGAVNPNPLVGAVIVKDEKVIGKGWHERFGGLHAERNALADCKESTEGATIYVTLEPCCHYGKTPPCTEAILGKRHPPRGDRILGSESARGRKRHPDLTGSRAYRGDRGIKKRSAMH